MDLAHVELDGSTPRIVLEAAAEKNRQGSEIPRRKDLVKDLRGWINECLRVTQDAARQGDMPIPARLPPSTPLLRVPKALDKILCRDLERTADGIRMSIGGKPYPGSAVKSYVLVSGRIELTRRQGTFGVGIVDHAELHRALDGKRQRAGGVESSG